jgi:hypothetical protein
MPEEPSGEFIIGNNADSNSNAATTVKSKPHFFSNLLLNPENIIFENQEEDEEIVLLVRRDLITNLPWVVTALVLILIPPLIGALSSLFSPFFALSSQTQLVATVFFYIMVFGFILVHFTLWYFNIGLVTNIRIIDLDVSGILSKHLSETRLNIIEDVSYSQVGSVRTIFNYGDVIMQTAGTAPNFEFDRAPEPARIVRLVADMIGGPR